MNSLTTAHLLDAISTCVNDAIIATDLAGQITLLNPPAEALTGWPLEEARGQPLGAVFRVVDEATGQIAAAPDFTVEVLEGPTCRREYVFTLAARDGREKSIEVSARRITADSVHPVGLVLSFRDVTVQRQTDERLRHSEQRFTAFMDRLPVSAFAKDEDGRYVYANPFVESMGHPPEYWIGKTDFDIFPAEYAKQYRANDLSVMQSGMTKQFEEIVPGDDGDHWLSTLKFLMHSDGRRLLGGMSLDITARKRAMQERDEILAVLNALVASAPLGIAIFDEQQRFRYINEPLAEMNGIPATDHIGKTVEAVLPNLSPEVRPLFDEVTRSGKTLLAQEVAGETPKAPGVRRFWEETWFPLTDRDGRKFGTGVIVHEVTDRKRVEDEREMFVSLVENSNDSIAMSTIDHRLFYLNPAGRRLVGLSSDADVQRIPISDFFFPEDWRSVREEFLPRIEREGHGTLEIRFRHFQTGEALWMIHNVFARHDANGQRQGFGAVSQDITARKKAEDDLRRAEERFRASQESSLIGFAILRSIRNADGQIVDFESDYVNPAAHTILNEAPSQLQHRRMLEFLPAEPRNSDLFERFARVVETGEAIDYEWNYNCRGVDKWLRNMVIKLGDGVAISFADMTASKMNEEKLRFQRDLNRAIADNATTCILLVDEHNCIEFMNPASEATTGYSFNEARGRDAHELFHHHRPDGRPFSGSECIIRQQLLEGGRLQGHEDVFIRKSGEFYPVLCHARPLYSNGQAVGTVMEFRDITAEKKAAAALRESEAHFRSMADNAPTILWVTDASGSTTYLSQRWHELTGRMPEEDLGFGWLENTHPDDRQPAREAFLRANERHEPFSIDYRLRRHDGTYIWVHDAGLPRWDENGSFQGFVGSVTDVHERHEAAEALRQADRRKDEFLATLAHELRNPLAPIRTGLEILKLAGDDRELAEETRAVMEQQLGQMIRLIDDLLDISRITRGRLQLRKEKIELAAAIRSALDATRPLMEEAGHTLTVNVPPEPIYVDADPTRLAQIFSNLLSNAAKYTQVRGHVAISAEVQGEMVSVSIQDTGIGIRPDNLERVFEMFSQTDPALERSQGGLGIGLSLVRGLVAMHGGTVEAHSEGVGKGSTFVVRLPVLQEAEPKDRKPGAGSDAAHPAPTRVLVVDDNQDVARMLGTVLKVLGNDVRTAHDGVEAVQQASVFRPRLVLLDIGMPRMNGYEAARRIREQPWGQDMILVAVTGWGQEEDKRRAAEAGFDHHLTKPVEIATVEKLLAEAAHHEPEFVT